MVEARSDTDPGDDRVSGRVAAGGSGPNRRAAVILKNFGCTQRSRVRLPSYRTNRQRIANTGSGGFGRISISLLWPLTGFEPMCMHGGITILLKRSISLLVICQTSFCIQVVYSHIRSGLFDFNV